MAKTVLVTGGSGFVASWCIAELLNRGYDVRTTIRSSTREPEIRAAAALDDQPGDRLTCVIADLTSDSGWDAAMKSVDYVLHVAQPMGSGSESDADLVTPARDGVLRVLKAAAEAGVERVVVTSAANAASPSNYTDESTSDEMVWTDPADPSLIPYRRAKTIGEKTAWDFMSEYSGAMTLTSILPGAVFGPIRSTTTVGSVGIIQRMLRGRMPGAPRIGFEIVDVRDLADLHIRAMLSPEAAGQRFLGTGEFMWMKDMALTLHNKLGRAAAKVSTRELPDFVVRFSARFIDKSLRSITPALGRRAVHTTDKARRVLGWTPRPAAQIVKECGESLIQWDLA